MTDQTDPNDPHPAPEKPSSDGPKAAAEDVHDTPEGEIHDSEGRDRDSGETAFAQARPPKTRRDPLPVLFGIGVVVLIGAVVFLWRHPLNLASFSSTPSPSASAAAQPPDGGAAPASSDTAPVPGNTQTAANPSPAASPPAASPPAASPPAAPAPATPAAAAPSSAAPAPVTAAAAPPPAPEPVPPVASAPPPAAPPAPGAADQGQAGADQLAGLQQQLDKLQQRLDQFAQHQPAPPDLGPLEQRITALENRPPPPPPPPSLAPELAALASRVDSVAARQDQLANREASDQTALAARLDALVKQVAELSGLSDRAARVARIQAATAALAAGRPLGELPGAPPALDRFRSDPPPTEAGLRLSFPAAAQAAEAAAEPSTGNLPFWQAVQDRAESLVTVRRGDRVLVGDPASGVIARARTALDAGDLAGAVTALATLSGPPAQAMAPWLSQAKALLDARAALAALAARA